MYSKNFIRNIIAKVIGYNNFTKINLLRYGGLSYLPIIRYADIAGWFTPKDAILLYDIARMLPKENPVVCEIGSFQGRSSLIIAKALMHKINPTVYCVDPFNADGDQTSIFHFQKVLSKNPVNLKETFIKNMKANKVDGFIHILQGYSHEVVKHFSIALDLLHIDGNHDCDAVIQDFNDWSRFIKPGGYIAFHDVTEPGVMAALNKGILNKQSWKVLKQADLLLIAKKLNN